MEKPTPRVDLQVGICEAKDHVRLHVILVDHDGTKHLIPISFTAQEAMELAGKLSWHAWKVEDANAAG